MTTTSIHLSENLAGVRYRRACSVTLMEAEGLLAQNETAFLHPYGVDTECDEARASLPG